MKVMHIGHTLLAAVNQEKLAHMAARGHPSAVVAPQSWKSGSLFAGKEFRLERPYDAIAYSAVPVWRSGHVASFLYSPTRLLAAIREFDPDIVHIEQEAYSFAAAEICLMLRGSRRIVTVFGWENLDRKLHPLQRLCRRIVRHRADGMIGGSRDAEALIRRHGYAGPTMVAPEYGVYQEYLDLPRAEPNQVPVIGFVGRHTYAKGGDMLLEALDNLDRNGHRFSAQFLGSGPDKAAWKALAASRGVGRRVRWIDSVPHLEVPAIMSAIDILVVPSRTTESWAEQFGQVITQAMALCVPVIGSDSGAIPEVIGRPDLIFPEDNIERLTALLARLLDDRKFRASAGAYGRRRVEERFTNEVLTEKYIAFWKSLEDGRQAGTPE